MRQAFIHTLASIAERDERIVLLTGDLGYMAVEPFQERFPDRFYNAGVAEQTIADLELGRRPNPNLRTLRAVAAALDLDPAAVVMAALADTE